MMTNMRRETWGLENEAGFGNGSGFAASAK